MTHAIRTIRQSVVSLLLLFTVVFFIIRIVPGDPATLMAGPTASPEQVQLLREGLGLDRPVWEQYLTFIGRFATGDLGRSIVTGQPVGAEILKAFPYTLLLVSCGMTLAVVLGVVAGFGSAVYRDGATDLSIMGVAVAVTSIPTFWLALLLIDLMAVRLGWLPSSGFSDWRSLILPSIVLASTQVGMIARLTRGGVSEVLQADYVRTAISKGVTPFRMVRLHVLRNAAVPIITVVGLQFGLLIGGAVVTETVFSWPGIGRQLIQAVLSRDYPMLQVLILSFGITFVVIGVAVDLLNAAIDPRMRTAQ